VTVGVLAVVLKLVATAYVVWMTAACLGIMWLGKGKRRDLLFWVVIPPIVVGLAIWAV